MDILTAKDFKITTCQATIFTPDEELSSAKLVHEFFPYSKERFDGDPLVLPSTDPPIPRNVPKAIIQSRSGAWRCEFASARISILLRRVEGSDQIILKDFFLIAREFISEYLKRMRPRVDRLAALVNRSAHHEEPGLFLSRHFCREQWYGAPLNRPTEFELHAHKRFLMGESVEVNSWVRSKSGQISSGGSDQRAVLLEQDINTIPAVPPDRDFAITEIDGFYQLIVPEVDSILALYYPET